MTVALNPAEPLRSASPAEQKSADPVTVEPQAGEGVGMVKAIVIGSVVGVVLSFLAVLLGMGLAGYGWGAGVGLGLFIAFWGGLGFGVMVGGVIHLSSLEDH